MASRIWSRWCAELRASSRISVNFSSFSLSSLFNCRIISASASVHSQILKKETSTKSAAGEARGLGKAMILLKAELQYYPAGTEIICCWQNLEKMKKSFTNRNTFIGSKLKRVGLCLSLFLISIFWSLKTTYLYCIETDTQNSLVANICGAESQSITTSHSTIFSRDLTYLQHIKFV